MILKCFLGCVVVATAIQRGPVPSQEKIEIHTEESEPLDAIACSIRAGMARVELESKYSPQKYFIESECVDPWETLFSIAESIVKSIQGQGGQE